MLRTFILSALAKSFINASDFLPTIVGLHAACDHGAHAGIDKHRCLCKMHGDVVWLEGGAMARWRLGAGDSDHVACGRGLGA